MKNVKRLLALCLVLAMLSTMLVACVNSENETETK